MTSPVHSPEYTAGPSQENDVIEQEDVPSRLPSPAEDEISPLSPTHSHEEPGKETVNDQEAQVTSPHVTSQDTEDVDVSGEPQDELEDFDWRHLQERYHAKIQELTGREESIMAEFESLCTYFSTWAQSGANREVDRTFKRLKTQMTLVQHHEDEAGKKRLHYVKVVDAFKSAIQLLAT